MEKQMYQGNWKCSGCGGAITQLPFEPRSESNLTCRDCHSKKTGGSPTEKKMFEGDWKCSKCGGAITKLPFEPKSQSNLTCRDCYMKERG
ncbi:hypothetical protein KKC45_00245 [Patescibacteria group bacterium]|nr:hypothetical protein [Patescibacteria group bacterium]